MRQVIRRVALAGLASAQMVVLTPAPVTGGEIARACLKADRRAATRQLCRCVERVAEQSMTRSDRKLMVKFFRDPAKAEEIRMSKKAKDDAFWDRYKAFSVRATKVCR